MKQRSFIYMVMVIAMTSANADELSAENASLELALARHAREQNQQSHLNLLMALNKARYVIPARDKEVKLDAKGIPTQESKFQFLLSSTPGKEQLLPLFTNRKELATWSKAKSDSVWNVSAQEAWTLAKTFNVGVIVNPLSAGWIMGEESITWLRNHK